MPRRDECPVTGIVSKANFVTANAVDTILAVPRGVGPPPVNYLEKEDYGKVPKYLQQVNFKRGIRSFAQNLLQHVFFWGGNKGYLPLFCRMFCGLGG